MDFPSSLRPTLFVAGPLGLSNVPDLSFMCSWRDALMLPESLPENSENGAPHMATQLLWEPETPGPLPLLPPGPDPWDPGVTAQDLLFRGGFTFRRKPQAVLDVTEQLSRFLWDHGDIAFAPLGKLMLENFKLEGARSRSKKKTVVSVKSLLQDLGGHQPWGCPWAFLSYRQRRFSILGGPVLGKSVASLLGKLLHEELAVRWEQLLLDDAFTGGALAWVPGRTPQVGQLVYPAGGALDKLCFQEVSLTSGSDAQALGDPGHIQLRGPVRQVVTRTVQGETLLAVRSDYHCALWKVSKQGQPAPLQVLQAGKGATGISLSPHLPGELAVCSRSGAVCLWTPQGGLQQVYKDPETLVFCDPSPWRWADFTAHPRVLTVGDRTGVKIIDTQGPPGCGLLLFRGGAEASCQKGERVLLTQYLGACSPEPLLPTLHLICTQFSLYLVDERLPLVPMLKWNHDLPSAPLWAQLLPPPRPGCPRPLLLGAQHGHLRLLHLTGRSLGWGRRRAGRWAGPQLSGFPPGEGASAPRLAGPPQSLPSSSDSLSAFPLLEPKSQWRLQERLKAPTIGLAATIPFPASEPVLSLFQLSAAGDVFHQRLCLQADPGATLHAPTASWTPQATACCSRWLKALLAVPPPPPVWAAPTFSHRRLLGCMEQRTGERKGPEGLRAAMAGGRLLQQRDLGPLPSVEPPPAPEPGPEDELSARLEAAWEGQMAVWWDRQRGLSSGPGRQPKRHKRRTQLSSTFSSLSGRLDLSDATSPPRSPDRASPEAKPRPPVTPPSHESTQKLWARGVPSERQQTLRDYMAKLPLGGDSPRGVCSPLSQSPSLRATPSRSQTPQEGTAELPPRRATLRGAAVSSSQTSSLRATPSRQRAPVPSGSQPQRKKPRMGF
ncbi:TATA box-binding protein-associated factor RNA polymerase I subunit C isoform X1 [Enhydra lutris kenyoni]|uniref:TATA box-binding protein-associated factor RNA polymerase I subunit C isoform X1 n=1 Tax=Enhydra lutris kenyoni TaxID=391180 RepID=A0A2Y9K2D7_ENHLU|nr:TATA box-binding protein-associated factor RNA polymerase I subunit C isoform X1 [Enhydra lutris kenyoni]XP_022367351.1 TATA box-binding protein-associated factor RNA polymerase I subunit C isoform X1 [Enhydra lutris kenyoni]